MKKKFYPSKDQLQLHYLEYGCPDNNKLCLLLHGFTNDAYIFNGLSEKLAKTHRVISVDFRGHGDSDWDPNGLYTHDHLVEDLLILLNTLDYQQLNIIGHSLGARVGILLIGRTGLKVNTLSIIDTGPEVRAIAVDKVRKDAESTPKEFPSVASYREFLANIYFLAEASQLDSLAENGLKHINGKLCPKTDPKFTTALWKPDSREGNSEDLRYPLNQELWDLLKKIDCPTLVLKGQASAILAKRTAEKMVNEFLSHGEFKVVERAGHAVMVDNPNMFETIECEFIDRHS